MERNREQELFKAFVTCENAVDNLTYVDKALVLRILSDRIEFVQQLKMKAEYAAREEQAKCGQDSRPRLV